MSKLTDFYRKNFKKLNIHVKDGTANVDIYADKLGEKLDYAQKAVDDQIWSDVKSLMPINTGDLIQQTNTLNINTSGQVYMYPPESPYGHYQYEGVMYVDPVYNLGAFYSPDFGFWSREGVSKIPSERNLTYSNPKAVSHWGEEAKRLYGKDWVRVGKRALKT